jgi:hypothetical protein
MSVGALFDRTTNKAQIAHRHYNKLTRFLLIFSTVTDSFVGSSSLSVRIRAPTVAMHRLKAEYDANAPFNSTGKYVIMHTFIAALARTASHFPGDEMKTFLILVAFILFLSTSALAGPGSIMVLADNAGTSCNFVDTGGLVQVYFFHAFTTGATASQFKLDVENTGWVHLGDVWPFPTVIGWSIVGVSIAYGTCQAGTYQLGMANFFGTSVPECTTIAIVPDPSSLLGKIEAVDCSNPPQKIFPTGGRGIVNQNQSCMCTIPVEETTWGQIKAQYQ